MKLALLPMRFTVCQLPETEKAELSPYAFLARTDEEISLVCPEEKTPECALNREDGWRCLKILGPLDFSLVGILSSIAQCLAAQKIPIFAISTYNTDYVLIKEERLSQALSALKSDGHEIEGR